MQEHVETNEAAQASAKDSLLIASKVREIVRGHQCNTSGDALDGLNAWVHLLIEQATKRAQANGRKTIRAHDFMA